MFDEKMPKGGVKELMRSKDGRDYLSKLQKRHWKDILQPSNPLFEKVYGDKLKRDAQKLEEKKRKSQDEWAELEERKQHAQKKESKT